MLSYKHGFHAGNFADLHKHIVLEIALNAFQRKEKPFSYMETHAGSGLYDLTNPQAKKNSEFKKGIKPLVDYSLDQSKKQAVPALIQSYLDKIARVNDPKQLRSYPGSPLIGASVAVESGGSAVLMELHTSESQKLKKNLSGLSDVHIHHRDGLEGVVGLLPPNEKRGLVLVDPSYELKKNYKEVHEVVQKMVARWAGGTILIWYPILAEPKHRGLIAELQRGEIRKIFHSTYLKASDPDSTKRPGMIGSGMLIVNPPWKFGDQLHTLFKWLTTQVFPEDRFTGEWLVPE